MSFSSRPYVNRYTPSNRFPVGVKWLLIVNIAISVAYLLFAATFQRPFFLENLALVPAQVVQKFAVWQVVTYLFIHFTIFHLLWNMLALWMFGMELERTWGTARFLRFYFTCGIIAGLSVIVAAYLFGGINTVTGGASGAIYAILVAYAVVFPDRTLLFGFLIPMKSKYFVMIIGAIVLLQSYTSVAGGKGDGVAVMAHLGGLVAGYLILRGRRLVTSVRTPAIAGYKEWKLQRAKRKFEVYLKKQDKRGPWVN